MSRRVDCIILGGGLVGLALALALARSWRVALVEAAPPPPFQPSPGFDPRVYAISPSSSAWLRELGVWQALAADRLSPIFEMSIAGDGGGYLEFSNLEAGREHLGQIVENSHLQAHLWQAAQEHPGIDLLCPGRPERLQDDLDTVTLDLAGGESVQGRLLIGADGANSWLRRARGLTVRRKDYAEWGVVANFQAARPHGGVARQWFGAPGILAWLPLPGNRISMVWSTDTLHADALLAQNPAALAAAVATAGHNVLGPLQALTPAVRFPLALQDVPRTVAHRTVLVGDAAHQVHPLAGQGVNLGFDDVKLLAGLLSGSDVRDPGYRPLLQAYEVGRRREVKLMQLVTDGLHALFAPSSPSLAWLRNQGLSLTNRQGWLKRQLIGHAVGKPHS